MATHIYFSAAFTIHNYTSPPLQVVEVTDYLLIGNTYNNTYGNIDAVGVITVGGGVAVTKVTTNTFGPSTWEQQTGRLIRTEVNTTRNTGGVVETSTRVSAFTYLPALFGGLLWTETIEPEDGAYTLTTTYSYDQFGNKLASERESWSSRKPFHRVSGYNLQLIFRKNLPAASPASHGVFHHQK